MEWVIELPASGSHWMTSMAGPEIGDYKAIFHLKDYLLLGTRSY